MSSPRRLVLLLALLPALLKPAQAQQQKATGATRLPLWKIEGKAASVYLLGSVHILKKDNYPLAAPIVAAFDKAKVVAFETDLEAMEEPEFQKKLATMSTLPAGETLSDHLSPKLYERLADHLKKSELPVEAVGKLKPGMAAMTIEYLGAQKLGFDIELGVDQHLHRRARTAGKEIFGLDTPDSHLGILLGLSKSEGEAMVEMALEDLRTLQQDFDELLKSWQTGDMKRLARLVNKSMEDHPELYKRLVVERNQRWIPKIENLIRGDKDAIVIVGAGHLAGKQSVIELLEKNKWKVAQQ